MKRSSIYRIVCCLAWWMVLGTAPIAGAQTSSGAPGPSVATSPIRSARQPVSSSITPLPPITVGNTHDGSPADSAGLPAGADSSVTPLAADQKFAIVIGPGDLLDVSVDGAPDYAKEVRVQSTGDITLPFAGTVHVSGLTPEAAATEIAKRLDSRNYFSNAQVSVSEKEMATQGISVMGEVQKPGVYPMMGPRRLFDAISAAGGTTERAGNTVLVQHRGDPQNPETVPLHYNGKTSASSNVFIYPGDTVVVSRAGVVYVIGDVHLPGGFVMDGSRMTVLQALALAQGANSTAALDRARIIRKEEPSASPTEKQISVKQILTAQTPDILLQPDDILFIPASKAKTAGRRTMEALIQTATGMAIYTRMP